MKKRTFLIIILIISVALPTMTAHADTGPKPDMNFTLIYNFAPVAPTDAKLFFCNDEVCASPNQVAGPFSCNETSCYYGYGGEGLYKLSITFNGITYESNVFKKRGFVANFKVEVNENDLFVKQTNIGLPYSLPLQFGSFLVALIFTLGIEIPLTGFVLKKWNIQPNSRSVLFINIFTLPFVWFIFPFLSTPILVIGLGELFALLTEAIFYMYSFQKEGISKYQATILSLVANAGSFLIPALFLLLIMQ